MKRIIAVAAALLFPLALFAAVPIPTPSSISVLTAAQVLTSTPTYGGQVIVCSGCTTNTLNAYSLCIATEATTAGNAYILVSTATAQTACK